MYDDSLEQLVLSGALFNSDGGKSSPPRAESSPPSPSSSRPASPAPENGSTYVGNSSHRPPRSSSPAQESIGLGPGRTGVKGVIRDRDEARERGYERSQKEKEELAAKQSKQDFSARTYFEEVDDRSHGADGNREGDAWGGVEEWRKRRLEELKGSAGVGVPRRNAAGAAVYGHLREVGLKGYVEAVEKVPRDVWVVLHIYDASLPRCAVLDSHLSSLARRHPSVKFLRARAGAIGFSTPAQSSDAPRPSRTKATVKGGRISSRTAYRDPDESDSDLDDGPKNFVGAYPREEDHRGEDDEDDVWEAEPDYDVLPTMLVYRGGELSFTWPRVEWEIVGAAGKGGGVGGGMDTRDVETFLAKYNIVRPPTGQVPADEDIDEDELEFATDVD